jgi:N-acetyl-anhydromuramyl-L-alanine amidase AmpD
MGEPMRKIDKIIVHCSDSDYTHHNDISVIKKWHVEENGWSDVGYHFFIKKEGIVQIGRDISVAGAHVKGYNATSIGICLAGKTKFTLEQFAALKNLIIGLREHLKEDIPVYPHNAFNKAKTCPNFDVKKATNLLNVY